jgi:predicted DNA-binding transcriptional regulator AlpA
MGEEANPFDALREALSVVWDSVHAVERATVEQVVANLMTASDIAEQYGYSSQSNLTNYRSRGVAFPDPVAKFGRTFVYWRPEVEKWMEERTRHARSDQASDAG